MKNTTLNKTNMKKLLKIEFERVFMDKKLYISMLIAFIIMGFGIYKEIFGYALKLNMSTMDKINGVRMYPNLFEEWFGWQTGLYGQIYYFVMPIIISFPYTATHYTDMKNKYIYQLITRNNRKNYYFAKYITQFVTGGSIAVIPNIVSFIICAMYLPFIMPQSSSGQFAIATKACVFGDLLYSHPFILFFVLMIIQFILFGMVNCIACIFSDILDNAFIVVISPFIVSFIENVISGSGIIKYSILSDNNVFMLQFQRLSSMLLIYIVLLILICTSFIIKCRREDIL